MQTDVAELSWEDVKKYIYTPDGSLPDTYVLNTTRVDWEKWAGYVNATYKLRFWDAYEQEHDRIGLAVVLQCWDDKQVDGWPFASILVGDTHVNCFFLAEDIIDGDIDPRQIKQPDDHLQLMQYLTSISSLLKKQVVMVSEGTRVGENNQLDTEPILTVDQGAVHTNAYWLNSSKG